MDNLQLKYDQIWRDQITLNYPGKPWLHNWYGFLRISRYFLVPVLSPISEKNHEIIFTSQCKLEKITFFWSFHGASGLTCDATGVSLRNRSSDFSFENSLCWVLSRLPEIRFAVFRFLLPWSLKLLQITLFCDKK